MYGVHDTQPNTPSSSNNNNHGVAVAAAATAAIVVFIVTTITFTKPPHRWDVICKPQQTQKFNFNVRICHSFSVVVFQCWKYTIFPFGFLNARQCFWCRCRRLRHRRSRHGCVRVCVCVYDFCSFKRIELLSSDFSFGSSFHYFRLCTFCRHQDHMNEFACER